MSPAWPTGRTWESPLLATGRVARVVAADAGTCPAPATASPTALCVEVLLSADAAWGAALRARAFLTLAVVAAGAATWAVGVWALERVVGRPVDTVLAALCAVAGHVEGVTGGGAAGKEVARGSMSPGERR